MIDRMQVGGGESVVGKRAAPRHRREKRSRAPSMGGKGGRPRSSACPEKVVQVDLDEKKERAVSRIVPYETMNFWRLGWGEISTRLGATGDLREKRNSRRRKEKAHAKDLEKKGVNRDEGTILRKIERKADLTGRKNTPPSTGDDAGKEKTLSHP